MHRCPLRSVMDCSHAGGVVIRERDGAFELVIITSSSGFGWVLPKGLIDPGETAEEAALREVEEEAALRCEVIAPLGEASIEKQGYSVDTAFFLMRVLAIVEVTEDRELQWCDFATARRMLSAAGSLVVLDRAETYLHR